MTKTKTLYYKEIIIKNLLSQCFFPPLIISEKVIKIKNPR